MMTYAIDLLDYAEKIPVIDSKRFCNCAKPGSRSSRFLGTPDLDALSICEKNMVIPCFFFEVWLSDINMISKGKSVTIIEFLNEIEKDDLIYMRYLVKFTRLSYDERAYLAKPQ